jgi:hypothetical protein
MWLHGDIDPKKFPGTAEEEHDLPPPTKGEVIFQHLSKSILKLWRFTELLDTKFSTATIREISILLQETSENHNRWGQVWPH